ncbi:MAG: hypothetical protein JXP34_07475 [Planctomycetes bacterium]|nr:hypothetical protein [Planctomycetota bacterium]
MHTLVALWMAACGAHGEPLDLKAIFNDGIPASPFMNPVYAYADSSLGRDPIARQNFIRILFFLKEISGEERYAKAAEASLRAALEQGISAPWLLWDASYALAPKESERIARESSGCVRALAEAFAHTRDPSFLEAVGSALEAIVPPDPPARLSLAIDCDGAARKVPEPLRTRLALRARREDDRFFASAAKDPLTPRAAMMAVSRYENTGDIRFRDLIVKGADACEGRGADPPMTLGHAISLELSAFRVTAQERYFRRAFALGEVGIERLSAETSSAGTDTLALALIDLHLTTRGITAVRAPVNSIDR